jgi:hypothetical protein
MELNEKATLSGVNGSAEQSAELSSRLGVWKKPTLERLSLNEALAGGSAMNDGVPGSGS